MDGDVCGGGGVQVQTRRSVHKPSHDNVINVVMEMNPKYRAGRSEERQSKGRLHRRGAGA